MSVIAWIQEDSQVQDVKHVSKKHYLQVLNIADVAFSLSIQVMSFLNDKGN